MGADPHRARADAGYAARLHHARHALHLVGAGTGRRDAARASLRDPKRRASDLGRRIDERRRHRSPGLAGREGGARRGGRARSRLQPQPGTHRRLLRRAGPPRRRQPTRRHPQPEGPGRAADTGAHPHARAGAARGRAVAAARGALAQHRHHGRAHLPRGRPARHLLCLHGGAAPRERDVAAVGRADAREPQGLRLRRRARRAIPCRDVIRTSPALLPGSAAPSACPWSTTWACTCTSCRAG